MLHSALNIYHTVWIGLVIYPFFNIIGVKVDPLPIYNLVILLLGVGQSGRRCRVAFKANPQGVAGGGVEIMST